jgi:hypothetical protein
MAERSLVSATSGREFHIYQPYNPNVLAKLIEILRQVRRQSSTRTRGAEPPQSIATAWPWLTMLRLTLMVSLPSVRAASCECPLRGR